MDVNLRVVIIGGSAGALEPLVTIVKQLKSDFGFAVVIVLHRMKNVESNFVEVLKMRTGKQQVCEIHDKDELLPNKIYVAPANYHLLVEENQVLALDYSEVVNFSRPSIDVAFESFAEVFKVNAIGVLLSGSNADGAKGLVKIRLKGGRVIIQDLASADSEEMPKAAIALNPLVASANPQNIAKFLNQIV